MSKTLADQLRHAILTSGLKQAELAERAGVPQSKISEFLNGAGMRLDNAGKIAKALGLELRKARAHNP